MATVTLTITTVATHTCDQIEVLRDIVRRAVNDRFPAELVTHADVVAASAA